MVNFSPSTLSHTEAPRTTAPLQRTGSMSNLMKRISGRFNRLELDQSFKSEMKATSQENLSPEQKSKADSLNKVVAARNLLSQGKKTIEASAAHTSQNIDTDVKTINKMAVKDRFKQALPGGLKTPKKTQLIQSAKVDVAKAEITKLQKELGTLEDSINDLETKLAQTNDPSELEDLGKELDQLHSNLQNKIEVTKARLSSIQDTFSGMRSSMTASVAKFAIANPKDKKLLENKNDVEKKFNREVTNSIKEFKEHLISNNFIQEPIHYDDAVTYMATRGAFKNSDLSEGTSSLVKQFNNDVSELKNTIMGFRDLMKDVSPNEVLSPDQIKDLKTEGGRNRMAADLANKYLHENRMPPKPTEGTSQGYQLVLQKMAEKVIADPHKSTFIISGSTTPILVAHLPGKDNVTFAFKFRLEDGFEGREDASKFSYMEHLGYAHPLSNVGSTLVTIDPKDLPETEFAPQEGQAVQTYTDFASQNGVINKLNNHIEFLAEEFVPNDGTLQKYTLTLSLAYNAVEEEQKSTLAKGPERFLALFGNANEAQLTNFVENLTINSKEMGSLQAHFRANDDVKTLQSLAITIKDPNVQTMMLGGLQLKEQFSGEELNTLAQAMGIDPGKLGSTLNETITNYEKDLKATKQFDTETVVKMRKEAAQKGLSAIKENITNSSGELSNDKKLALAQYFMEGDKNEYIKALGITTEQFNELKLTPQEQQSFEAFIGNRHETIQAGNTSKPALQKELETAIAPMSNRITAKIMEIKHGKAMDTAKELGFDITEKDFLVQSFFTDNAKKNADESWTIRYLNDDIRNQDDNVGGLLFKRNGDGSFALKGIDFEESRPRMSLATEKYLPNVEASRALVAHDNAPKLPAETKARLLQIYGNPKKMIDDLKREISHINPELASKKEIHPDGYEMDQLVNYDFERASKHAIRAHLNSEPAHDDPNYDKWAKINVRTELIDNFKDFWVSNKMASMSPDEKENAWNNYEAALISKFSTTTQS